MVDPFTALMLVSNQKSLALSRTFQFPLRSEVTEDATTRAWPTPAAGIVRIHANTMFPATPQRTAESRLVAPTPITAEVMVWVVEIGASKTYDVV